MTEVIILGILSVFLSWLEGKRLLKHGLKISFGLIFLFTALRFNFGTDYQSYFQLFTEVNIHQSIFDIRANEYKTEIGWLILCYIFKPIGFYGLIFSISALICYTYYTIIRKYVTPKYYWFAVLIYVFFSDVMLIQFSAIRQSMSIAIFISSIKYLCWNRNIIIFIILNTLSGFIHSSGFFMIIIIVFAFPKIQNSNYAGYLVLIMFFIFLFYGNMLRLYLPQLSYYFVGNRYDYRFDIEITKKISFLGSLFWSLYITIVLYYTRFQPPQLKVILFLCSFYFLIYPITNYIDLSGRMAYYFAPLFTIAIPMIFRSEKNIYLRLALLVLFTIFIFYNFNNFLAHDWVIEGYKDYQTIFSIL